jgi:outer membrane protein TolC
MRLPVVAAETCGEDDGMFAGQRELSLDLLVDQALARNASIQAMAAAWRAAAARYPQVVSLEDPMFMAMVAPGSFNSSQVDSAYVLQGSQKLPWPGKLAAKGQGARAEADAAMHEVRDTRLQVAEAAQLAYFEYYLVRASTTLNEHNLRAIRELRSSARSKYEANEVTQQDVLQADVELAEVERRQLELRRMDRVAVARINTLLRRHPQATLPPPARQLPETADVPPPSALIQFAMQQRPDLAALGARVRSEEAAVRLAQKQYYPDVDVFGRYDSFWQPASTQSDLRGQVGLNVNVPTYRRRLAAAVCEAEARLSQRRAEYRQRVTDIQYEVQVAYEQLEESRRAVQLYQDRFVPAAEQNATAASDNYNVGKISFLALVEAQRQLIVIREKQQAASSNYYQRRAELERIIGSSIPDMATSEQVLAPEPTTL